ncbi:MAG TPA: metallopeptidase family protein [Jatrophihabitantaceae bacterium]|nr:metallopeptidase family protein [Jatrophihabitantaceae bacterium]
MLEISRRRFGELVDDALDSVPEELIRLLDNVVVQIEDRDEENPGLLGLYRGVALTERDSHYSFQLPDSITIYREAILAICATEQDVAREVAITVVHEIGHHFGIDDERLHELGWA